MKMGRIEKHTNLGIVGYLFRVEEPQLALCQYGL